MKFPVFCLLLVVGLPTLGRTDEIDDIYQSIQRGKFRQAEERLAGMRDVSTNGNLLFLSGLLERSADRSSKFFETALERGVAVKYQEEIFFRLAQYYLQVDKLTRLSELTNEYRTRFERGKYRSAMLRLRVLAEELSGDRTSALGMNERYLQQFSRGEAADWGKVDLARILLGSRGDETGVEEFERLSTGRSDIAVPQAMVLLGLYHLDRGEKEAAMRSYDLLREEYPQAVGVDQLGHKLGAGSVPTVVKTTTQTPPTENANGYAIQVGAFSSEKIAREQVDRLKRERLASRIEKKQVDGRTLWVVYLGEYKTLRSADEARTKLQKRYGETYETVPR